MPEAQCVKYPIRPGQREALVSWIARLQGFMFPSVVTTLEFHR